MTSTELTVIIAAIATAMISVVTAVFNLVRSARTEVKVDHIADSGVVRDEKLEEVKVLVDGRLTETLRVSNLAHLEIAALRAQLTDAGIAQKSPASLVSGQIDKINAGTGDPTGMSLPPKPAKPAKKRK